MKILVVEDEKDLNKIITKYLKKSNYSVDSAYDGEEALDYYSILPFRKENEENTKKVQHRPLVRVRLQAHVHVSSLHNPFITVTENRRRFQNSVDRKSVV